MAITPHNKLKSQAEQKEKFLPVLRKDIQILPVGENADGKPLYNIYDPVRARYFQISWAEALIFKLLRPKMTMSEMLDAIKKRAPIDVNEEGLKAFFQDAARHNLLEIPATSEELDSRVLKSKTNPFMWLLFHYLYIRVPLVDPDAFLDRTLKYVKPFISPLALILYALVALSGLFVLIKRFDDYIHTFTYFFNLKGVVAYSLTLIVIKVIHEFSHAYTAKKFGVKVSNMGLAFLVLWPVLYTDVTDGWKLSKRYQRFMISCAGIIAELSLAGLATWGWVLTQPGVLQSVFFLVSSATWINSLFMNLNPAMRFDGYYILGDLWGIDNLQSRAFAITRWQMRKWFLGIDIPPPEEVSAKRKFGLILYSVFTWIYRLSVYIAVALFVYFYFTKVLGIFLFVFEIVIFIIWPICSEISEVYNLKKFIKMNRRIKFTIAALVLFLAYLVIPLPVSHSFPAIVVPSQEQILYIPYEGIIKEIDVKRQDKVKKGEVLLRLQSEALETDIQKLELAIEILKRELLILTLSDERRSEILGKQAELKTAEAKLNGLNAIRSQLTLNAKFDGIVYELDETLKVEQPLSKDKVIGKVASYGNKNAACYISESQIRDVTLGQQVNFRITNPPSDIPGKILNINSIRDQLLDYPQLASINQGNIPVVKEANSERLRIVESYYLATVGLESTTVPLHYGKVGEVEADGPWRSRIVMLFQYLQRIFWRESNI